VIKRSERKKKVVHGGVADDLKDLAAKLRTRLVQHQQVSELDAQDGLLLGVYRLTLVLGTPVGKVRPRLVTQEPIVLFSIVLGTPVDLQCSA
jgi:hypothetical protein